MDLILVAVISLGAIGLIAAVILYAASKKFAVYEDPRIAKVSESASSGELRWMWLSRLLWFCWCLREGCRCRFAGG